MVTPAFPAPMPALKQKLGPVGYIKALDDGLRATIAAHPAAGAISLLWAQMPHEISDRHASTGHVDFNEALQRGLRTVGARINEAAGIVPSDPVT